MSESKILKRTKLNDSKIMVDGQILKYSEIRPNFFTNKTCNDCGYVDNRYGTKKLLDHLSKKCGHDVREVIRRPQMAKKSVVNFGRLLAPLLSSKALQSNSSKIYSSTDKVNSSPAKDADQSDKSYDSSPIRNTLSQERNNEQERNEQEIVDEMKNSLTLKSENICSDNEISNTKQVDQNSNDEDLEILYENKNKNYLTEDDSSGSSKVDKRSSEFYENDCIMIDF